jgi:glycosyltransferase involved in cell wall biosynthesis/peptidoglycan/xylan/chitin deacetylase (PgdA/CDA1 family)
VTVSIIIPTFNRGPLLERTLPTVLAQDFPPDELEVIVVSDGSTDSSRAFVATLADGAAFRLTYVERMRMGAAAARNAGVAAATGRLLLFLDDDFTCPPGLVRTHVLAHAGAEPPSVVFGRIEVDPASPPTLVADATRLWYRQYFGEMPVGVQKQLHQHIWLISNSSMPRSLFLEHGGFDEEMPWPREDVEFGLRLFESGVPLVYDPAAVAAELVTARAVAYARGAGRAAGAAEVVLTRKHASFRPSSLLTPIGKTFFKRRLRRALVASPVPLEALFGPAIVPLERFARRTSVRSAGVRLMGFWHHLEAQRSAQRTLNGPLASEFGRTVPVLMYHHVGPAGADIHPALTVPPVEFERQLRWLATHGYTAIAPSEWLDWCVTGAQLPSKPVMLTFDDGYRDLATYAFPAIERLGFRAGVYVVADRVGKANNWDDLGANAPLLLTADELREWSARGIEVGAHSRTHRRLAGLDKDVLASEISGSGRLLDDIAGPVRTFAYPYGAYDDRVVTEARNGFELAFTVEEGLNDLGSDLHRLARTMVQPGRSTAEFALQVRLGWNPIERARLKFAAVRRLLRKTLTSR